jgi:hypothetical protein
VAGLGEEQAARTVDGAQFGGARGHLARQIAIGAQQQHPARHRHPHCCHCQQRAQHHRPVADMVEVGAGAFHLALLIGGDGGDHGDQAFPSADLPRQGDQRIGAGHFGLLLALLGAVQELPLLPDRGAIGIEMVGPGMAFLHITRDGGDQRGLLARDQRMVELARRGHQAERKSQQQPPTAAPIRPSSKARRHGVIGPRGSPARSCAGCRCRCCPPDCGSSRRHRSNFPRG